MSKATQVVHKLHVLMKITKYGRGLREKDNGYLLLGDEA